MAKTLDEEMVCSLLRFVRVSVSSAKVHRNADPYYIPSSTGDRRWESKGIHGSPTHWLGEPWLTGPNIRFDAGDKLRVLQACRSIRQFLFPPWLLKPSHQSSNRLLAERDLPAPCPDRHAQQQSRPTPNHEHNQER